jgi:dihydrofolate reductase
VGDAVAALKEQPGEDILIYGSARLVNTLCARDLIDRYRLMVFPVTLGAGKRLFSDHDVGLKAFRLADAATTSTGVAMLTYQIGKS